VTQKWQLLNHTIDTPQPRHAHHRSAGDRHDPRHLSIDNVDTFPSTAYLPHEQHPEGIMRVVVKKWGNSASVRIPAPVMAAARLSLDQPVEVREEEGRIVIEPVRDMAYDLATLIEGITDANRHDAVDFGPVRGREAW
jgi:antitoxin MazE